MSTHNICLYKEVDIKYTGCNLKTMELLDCALIAVCAVIRSNTVLCKYHLLSEAMNYTGSCIMVHIIPLLSALLGRLNPWPVE